MVEGADAGMFVGVLIKENAHLDKAVNLITHVLTAVKVAML